MKNWSLPLVALAILFAGCSSNPKTDEKRERDPVRQDAFRSDPGNPLEGRRKEIRDAKLDAEQLYRRARATLDSSDFASAIEAYDDLSKRHPFSDYTTQGELERIYAQYRNFEPDRAISGAERFLREHPRHAAVDYLYYLKGLVNYDRDESGLNILPSDESKSDVTSQRRAFDDFALLIQKFPKSRFAGDAYKRMVYVRNRLAAHELHVVDFYLRRGAYVAASKRAEQVIAQYPGSPASYRALGILVQCYESAGMDQQAKDARRLLDAQDPKVVAASKTDRSDEAPAPVVLAAPEPAAASQAVEPAAAKKSLLARIAGAFNPFDNEGVEIVIPSAKPAAGAESGAAKSEATATEAAANADAAPAKSSKVDVFFEPYDDSAASSSTAATPANAPAASTTAQ